MGTVNNNSSNSVVISIALPAGVDVEAGTVSGDGMVSGVSGHTRLNTVSGSVLADGTAGRTRRQHRQRRGDRPQPPRRR